LHIEKMTMNVNLSSYFFVRALKRKRWWSKLIFGSLSSSFCVHPTKDDDEPTRLVIIFWVLLMSYKQWRINQARCCLLFFWWATYDNEPIGLIVVFLFYCIAAQNNDRSARLVIIFYSFHGPQMMTMMR
jgi:hypothetical protein